MTGRAEPSWAGRRALIAGGLGFIGLNRARHVVAAGAQVTLVDGGMAREVAAEILESIRR